MCGTMCTWTCVGIRPRSMPKGVDSQLGESVSGRSMRENVSHDGRTMLAVSVYGTLDPVPACLRGKVRSINRFVHSELGFRVLEGSFEWLIIVASADRK